MFEFLSFKSSVPFPIFCQLTTNVHLHDHKERVTSNGTLLEDDFLWICVPFLQPNILCDPRGAVEMNVVSGWVENIMEDTTP